MGQLITEVKVTFDYKLKFDRPFYFKTVTDGTEEDMLDSVARGLAQKRKEGEIKDEEIEKIRSVTIDSNDEKGWFASIVTDASNFFKRF